MLDGVAHATGPSSHATDPGAPTTDALLVSCGDVETGREASEAAALRRAAAIAASATPMVDPLQGILELALPMLPTDHLVLLRASTDRMESVIVAAAGTARVWRWLRAPLGRGIASRVIETGEAQLVSAVAGDPDVSTGQLTRSVLVVPVILHGSVLGVLMTADERRRFTRRHLTLLGAFADQCAIAISRWTGPTAVGE
jgi:GAF domain-containing protein